MVGKTTATQSNEGEGVKEEVPVVAPVALLQKNVKVHLPDKFKGNRRETKRFLGQVELYLAFNQETFITERDKILFTISNLDGDAFDWVQPYYEDYMGNAVDQQEEGTQRLFKDFEGFKGGLKKIFGTTNEKDKAAFDLQQLRQTGAVNTYISLFQQKVVQAQYDEDSAIPIFVAGLKHEVQKELLRKGLPKELADAYDRATTIDDWLYRFSGSNRRTTFVPRPRGSQGNKGKGYPARDSRRTEPMDLSATSTKKTSTPKRNKSQVECYNCGKKGHFKRECRQGKQAAATRTVHLHATRKEPTFNRPIWRDAPQEVDTVIVDATDPVEWGTDWESDNDSEELVVVPREETQSPTEGTGVIAGQETEETGKPYEPDPKEETAEDEALKGHIREYLYMMIEHGKKHWSGCYNPECKVHTNKAYQPKIPKGTNPDPRTISRRNYMVGYIQERTKNFEEVDFPKWTQSLTTWYDSWEAARIMERVAKAMRPKN